MDREEFLLQRNGYVEAIRHPEFVRAIAAGDYGRIAVTYVEWSGPSWQKTRGPMASDRQCRQRRGVRRRS